MCQDRSNNSNHYFQPYNSVGCWVMWKPRHRSKQLVCHITSVAEPIFEPQISCFQFLNTIHCTKLHLFICRNSTYFLVYLHRWLHLCPWFLFLGFLDFSFIFTISAVPNILAPEINTEDSFSFFKIIFRSDNCLILYCFLLYNSMESDICIHIPPLCIFLFTSTAISCL